jgi:16S rRNA C967 or C1407 C5-methylase (RsmB/RsmF family)
LIYSQRGCEEPLKPVSEESLDLRELSERFKFSEETLGELLPVYGPELGKVVRALKSPGKRYYVRANTLKTTPEKVRTRLADRGFDVSQHKLIPEALWVPIEGPFEVPARTRKVMVDKFTAESVLQGANVYAPGIARCSKVRIGDGVNIIDDEGETLAFGFARMNETQILTFRKGLAIEVTDSRFRVPSFRELPEFGEGLIYPQSLPAILTSRILDPKPNDVILDMTCSPGGKLSHISQLMGNQGRVIGVDRNRRKIEETMETCTRLDCSNVTLFVHDSRYLSSDFSTLKPDKVLVDPPCSALGIMPKVYEYTAKSEIEALARYQKQFLEEASKIVKPGGQIVYSVCTLTLQECERNALHATETCKLSIQAQLPMLGDKAIPIQDKPTDHCQRFHPHKHDAGFFIASFQRQTQ